MKIYGYFRSSAAYRCRIALNLLGIEEIEPVYIHLTRGGGEQKSAEYSTLNPQKLIPSLEVDGQVLTQSLAIIEYLNETHGGTLLGDNASPVERAQIRGFSQIIACDIHPLQNLRVLQYIASEYGQTEQTQKDAWCQKWLGDGLAACEKIAKRGTGKFTFGDTPTLADICLIPQMFSAKRFNVDTTKMPRLCEIFEYAETSPAFANAAPSKQPDAE